MIKNRKLSKHIGDVAWYSFVDKLIYKASDTGKRLLKINKFFASSKTCSACKNKNEELSLKEREWICKECGAEHNRDINAAYNIKQEGIINLKAEGLSISAN